MKNKIIIKNKKGINIKIEPNLFDKKYFSRFFIPLVNSFKKNEIVEIITPFLKFPLLVRSQTSDILNAEEIFINEDYGQNIPFKINTIIDAGANVGFASIYYSRRFPKSKILALEPEKSNFKILKKNVRPYPKVIPINKALWNSKTFLNISNRGKTENWGFMVEESKNTQNDITSLTVQECMKILQTQTIDIFKIDIEGSEKELFEKNINWLSNVKFLVIELHEKMRVGSTESFYNAIKKYNFKEIKLKKKYAKHMRVLLNRDYLK